MDNNAPKGIGFFNIKSGETHYAQLEPQIQAFINSSDLGINASRGQDFGWRLEPEWVKRVKAFRRDEAKMEVLLTRNGDQEVTIPQILYAIYGAQIRAAQERANENENSFEEEYLQDISNKPIGGVENASTDPSGNNTEGLTGPSAEESVSTAEKAEDKTAKPKASNKKQ